MTPWTVAYIVSIVYMCQFQSSNSFHCLFPLGIHTFVPLVCVSISAFQIRLCHFSIFHIYYVIAVFLFLIYFTLYDAV